MADGHSGATRMKPYEPGPMEAFLFSSWVPWACGGVPAVAGMVLLVFGILAKNNTSASQNGICALGANSTYTCVRVAKSDTNKYEATANFHNTGFAADDGGDKVSCATFFLGPSADEHKSTQGAAKAMDNCYADAEAAKTAASHKCMKTGDGNCLSQQAAEEEAERQLIMIVLGVAFLIVGPALGFVCCFLHRPRTVAKVAPDQATPDQ